MKEKIEKFENLIVWQRVHELVLEVDKITKDFPREERFGAESFIEETGKMLNGLISSIGKIPKT